MMGCYKYLECAVDEHLELKDMVQDKTTAGMKALGAWLNRGRLEVDDVGLGTFRKLVSARPGGLHNAVWC